MAKNSTAPAHPYTFGKGTRLSSAYTIGRKGLPCPPYCRDHSSAAYKAWKVGSLEYTAAFLRGGNGK